jgi:hypothetical protein
MIAAGAMEGRPQPPSRETQSMMTNLGWSALFFAAIAAMAFWNSGDSPDCDARRPMRGERPCCERHRTGMSKTEAVTLVDPSRSGQVPEG